MSDEESYEYEYDDDASDGGGDQPMDQDNDDGDEEESFEYTDDDEGDADDVDVALENAYYNAKGLRETDLAEAEEAFQGVVTMEGEELAKQSSGDGDGGGGGSGGGEGGGGERYGPWSYKAIKQLVKLHLRSGDGAKMMQQYARLLRCVASGAVSPNAVEKGVNGMLERVSSLYLGQEGGRDADKILARDVYDSTLQVFHPRTGSSPNERLWFKTNLKYGQLLYEMNETAKLQLVIRDLLRGSNQDGTGAEGGGGSVSAGGSTNLMEIYALQIQLYSRQKDNKKLREIFDRAMRVQGGIPHPRTLALIQELGGKMHMASREFESAGKTFFQAFKSYDEAGDPSRLRCLKYLVMASMLHASTINPFDSQEARPYRDDPEIVAMTNLVQAFHGNEIKKFEGILRRNEGKIMDDEFVREHLADLLRTIRTQVLQQVIGPYSRIGLKAIARELNGIPTDDVESLLVGLILDGRLDGRIDQVAGVLLKSPERGGTGSASAGGSGGGSGSGASSSAAAGPSSGPAGGSGAGSASAGGGAASSAAGAGGAAAAGSSLTAGGTIESRNTEAIDRLASALESLTAAVTSAGGRNSYHQIM